MAAVASMTEARIRRAAKNPAQAAPDLSIPFEFENCDWDFLESRAFDQLSVAAKCLALNEAFHLGIYEMPMTEATRRELRRRVHEENAAQTK